MFKAEHERMFQEANIGIIEIRKAELDFYLRVSAALGTQAALIGGFAYLTFSQNLMQDYTYTYTINAIYYVASGLTIAFAIHVVVTTMLIQILGPGLALNGPTGSMVRAVDGMRIEQRQILGAFFIMMILFATATLLLFWVTMDFYSAVIASGGFLLCARYWLYYCGRIYRRFHWDMNEKRTAWRTSSLSSADEPVVPLQLQKTSLTDNPLQDPLYDVESNNAAGELASDKVSEKPTFMERISFVSSHRDRPSIIERVSNAFMPMGSAKEDARQSFVERPSMSNRASFIGGMAATNTLQVPGTIMVNPKDISCEGFAAMNIAPKSAIRQKVQLERRYVTLNFRGQIFFYKTRQDFRAHPSTSQINPRPLSLDEFYVSTEKQDISETASVATLATSASLESESAKFMFILIPRDDEKFKNWQFRTDTEEELEMWLRSMRTVSPSSFR